MPAPPVVQSSIVSLENGNAILHVSEASENISHKVAEVVAKFKSPFKFRWIDLTEQNGLSTFSAVLEPTEGSGEKIFIYRADRALFFARIEAILRKFGISDNDVSKCALAESMGWIAAAYVYEVAPVVSQK